MDVPNRFDTSMVLSNTSEQLKVITVGINFIWLKFTWVKYSFYCTKNEVFY